jgi:serine/threonine-protein kinase
VASAAAACPSCSLVRPPGGWPVDANIGRLIHGKYRVESRLSAGGFGTVFIATQVHGEVEMGRVILKFLHQEHATDPVITKRFVNEVRTARELINPHIVRVFDLGYDDDGTPFMVQEFIEGKGLDEKIADEKRLVPAVALKIAAQVAEGLAEAHRKQIVHRDLKPENLRIQDGTGLVKILDFGIARISSTRGTGTNSFLGTPRYMPPEQIKQQTLDNGVDIFALGVIVFEMLAGEPPIPHEQSEMEYIHLNLIESPRRLVDMLPDCPVELSELVDSMMSKRRAERPVDMEAVAARLHEIALRFGWTEENTGRFRLAPEGTGARVATVALPTRDRTPSPPVEGEEVVELAPVRKSHTALWALLGGVGGAVALALVLLLLRGGAASAPGTPGSPGADDGRGVPGAESAGDASPPPGADAGKEPADAGEEPADATASADVAAVPETIPDTPPDGAAAKVEPDAGEPDAGPAPPDVAPVEPVQDAGTASRPEDSSRPADAARRRDAGHRDAGSGARDAVRSAEDRGASPFIRVGGSRDGSR